MQEKRAIVAKSGLLLWPQNIMRQTCTQNEYHPWCVFCYLAVRAIRVAYRHKDLWEELLGLLLCVLLLCYTSGCIWGAPQITRISAHHRDPRFNPQLNFFCYAAQTNILKKSIDVEAHRIWRKGKKCKERGETRGKQFKTFRKRLILVWLGIEPTLPILWGTTQASLYSAWW